jgi:hypothetical protein
MIYVYLENSIVKDLVRVNPLTVFAPEYAEKFIECENDNVSHEWSFADGEWTAPIEIEVLAQVPSVISMRQARLQLLVQNLLDDVDFAILAMSQAAQIEWEYATEVRRDNPLVLALQTALSMTDSDMDLFFELAAKI